MGASSLYSCCKNFGMESFLIFIAEIDHFLSKILNSSEDTKSTSPKLPHMTDNHDFY